MNKSSINFIKKDYEKFNKENCFTTIKGVQHFAQPHYILFLKNNLIDFLEPVKECYYFKLDYFKLDYFKKKSKNIISTNKDFLLENSQKREIKRILNNIYEFKSLKNILNIISNKKDDVILISEVILNPKNNIKGLFLQNKNTLDSAFLQALN